MTTSPQPAPNGQRRRLFPIAVRDYGDGEHHFTRGIDEQLGMVRGWWAADQLGERALHCQPLPELGCRGDLEAFVAAARLRDCDEDDVVVVYVTGHGLPGPSNRHYLLLPKSDPQRLLATAYPTMELVAAVLDSRARHVLVVVNSCYCGQLDEELARLRKDLSKARQELTTVGVFVSADHDERPRVREFGELLRRVDQQLRSSAGIAAEFLTFDEFDQELARAAQRDPRLLQPLKLWPRKPADQPSPCLPNPGYRPVPDLVGPARRQVAFTVADVEYWLGRASGRPTTEDAGWYFTGRHTLMVALCAFLQEGTGVQVVTGAAGTGKSALIARAVTLSDPAFLANPDYQQVVAAVPPDALPPEGSIDAAVLARNRSVDEIAALLLTALGHTPLAHLPGQPRTPALREQLTGVVAATPGPTTLVIDGVDEAESPYALLTDLLGPLARLTHHKGHPGVRLILGVRSATGDAAAGRTQLVGFITELVRPAAVHLMRTDDPGITDDIAGYVDALLDTVGSYRHRDVERATIARIVAGTVSPSFLDARLAGQRLRGRAEVQDPHNAAWLASLGEGIVGQLREDLRDVSTPEHPAGHLAAVLRAAAFAAGAGIPWADIWPTVAAAVLDMPQGPAVETFDPAIGRVLGSRLAGYLVTDVEDGRTVYRLAHEQLAQVLRRTPARVLTERR